MMFDLKESNFYLVCRQNKLLTDLEPEFQFKFPIEMHLEEEYPREQDDVSGRIFVMYSNIKGNSEVIQIKNEDRLEKQIGFNIDDFINKFDMSLADDDLPDNINKRFDFLLTVLLTTSLISIMDLGETPDKPVVKIMNEVFVKSAVSCIYNDPLDVFILLKDTKDGESGEYITKLKTIFATKSR